MKQGQTFCNGQDVLAIVFVSTEIRETLFVVVKNNADYLEDQNKIHTFATLLRNQSDMVVVVQLVRASDCGSECRGFESHQPPKKAGTMRIVPAILFPLRKLACRQREKNGSLAKIGGILLEIVYEQE